MPDPRRNNAHAQLASVPDLPLLIEQLQDQLDQLRATVEAQQTALERQAARLHALETRPR